MIFLKKIIKYNSPLAKEKLLFCIVLPVFTFDFYTRWAKVNQKSNFFFQRIEVIDQLHLMLLI